MIVSFKHKGLKRLYDDDDGNQLPPGLVVRIGIILNALDTATSIDDIDRPSFRLHRLKGERKDQWAVTVRANWCIVFSFDGQDITHVDFVDYH